MSDDWPGTRLSWLGYFLEMAWLVARRSRDTTRVGAVIVDTASKAVISTGYNGFPRGVAPTPDRLKRPAKYEWTVHAEENAIFNAARLGHSTLGATLFVSDSPCHRCARAIVQAGIVRVVVPHAIGTWRDPGHASHRRRDAIFNEAGIELVVPRGGDLKESI